MPQKNNSNVQQMRSQKVAVDETRDKTEQQRQHLLCVTRSGRIVCEVGLMVSSFVFLCQLFIIPSQGFLIVCKLVMSLALIFVLSSLVYVVTKVFILNADFSAVQLCRSTRKRCCGCFDKTPAFSNCSQSLSGDPNEPSARAMNDFL